MGALHPLWPHEQSCCAALILHKHGALPGRPANVQKGEWKDYGPAMRVLGLPYHSYHVAQAATNDALGLLHLPGRRLTFGQACAFHGLTQCCVQYFPTASR